MRIDPTRLRTISLSWAASIAAVMGGGFVTTHAQAQVQEASISLRNSFPIGSNGLCEAQIKSPEPGAGLFDRSYTIVCRDTALPVGAMWVQRGGSGQLAAEHFAGEGAQCRLSQNSIAANGLTDAQTFDCIAAGSGLERQVVVGSKGNRLYAGNSLTVYRDALRLGIGSLVTDRLVAGAVEVPLTQAGDDSTFARAQAQAISADASLAEAYRRSNAGNFAEAAEFFATSADAFGGTNGATEALLNGAMQQSNLGNFRMAQQMFAAADQGVAGNLVLARLIRNFRALDALNKGQPDFAIAILDTPLPTVDASDQALRDLQIDGAFANRLVAEQTSLLKKSTSGLTPLERAQLIDAQSSYVRASALRLAGRGGEAATVLEDALQDLLSVREGRIASVRWLSAQMLGELAAEREERGNISEAASLHSEAVQLLSQFYPDSPALLSAEAQLAGLYARNGREADALSMFRGMTANKQSKPAPALRRLLAPYFHLLLQNPDAHDAAAEMFAAGQLLLRPGLAQTQAVLARELSGGSDEASQLFRRSVNLSRAIERMRAELAEMELGALQQSQLDQAVIAQRTLINQAEQEQLETQTRLAAYPRYRAATDGRLSLAELQTSLLAGEAYLKLVTLDDDAYAIFIRPTTAKAYRIDASPAEIGDMVNELRDSIAIEEFGQTITYPFAIETARKLYSSLFGPVTGEMATVRELIFEPDGSMLRLPANLLVMDDASVERYNSRMERADADPYDFTGTKWLGREMEVTTSVSPSSFRDVRTARASNATSDYIGFGQNTPLGNVIERNGGVRSAGNMNARCQWNANTWNNPVKADELQTASTLLGAGNSAILTGGQFTDTHLKEMDNLDEYRILHFATHGLVTAPQPECPPQPALLTSFGDQDSDGLLSFAEIFDLQIDADLVILSACNTASGAGLVSSSNVGVSDGGDYALDGLVRAFVGAGGRTVVASHWPVPDDYNATRKLMTGFFEAGPNIGTAQAMRQSQIALMDDLDTSHPFYWAAFAIVGDGSVPVRR